MTKYEFMVKIFKLIKLGEFIKKVPYFTQFGHMAELSDCGLVLQKTFKKRYFA
jgi:hypothetical protein